MAKKELKLHWQVDIKTHKRMTYKSEYRGQTIHLFPPDARVHPQHCNYTVRDEKMNLIATGASKSIIAQELYKHFNG